MKDNFSQQAGMYAKYRPGYPQSLFDFILKIADGRETAWDCATGNGQTAKELASHFDKIYATDISRQQLDYAEHIPNIFYSQQAAEQTNFSNNSFDLVTVSQALHWLRFNEFYTEVKRVTRPGGWIAVWMYGLLRISPEHDLLINDHYFTTLGKYWDPERKYVDDNYSTIPFPFEEIKCPVFQIQYEWTIEELKGYLETWSALQKFRAANGYNPVDELIQKIKRILTESRPPGPVGGPANEKMNISFPLHLRMGKIDK